MKVWLDAQLSPRLARWLSQRFALEVANASDLGLREAHDEQIFLAAREADLVVMTKDHDFVVLLDRLGPPPRVLWVTCGNTSEERMRAILERVLPSGIAASAPSPAVLLSLPWTRSGAPSSVRLGSRS